MSLLLLMIAFVATGAVTVTNKALHEFGMDAYRETYLLAFYGIGAVIATAVRVIRPTKIRAFDAKLGLAMGVSGSVSLIFFLIAIAGMQGIVVFPVRNMCNILFTAIVSYFAWKERLNGLQWLGVAASLAAIFLLY